MRKVAFLVLGAAIWASSPTASWAACDWEKFNKCVGQCNDRYPNDDQFALRLACANGCGFGTECMDTTG